MRQHSEKIDSEHKEQGDESIYVDLNGAADHVPQEQSTTHSLRFPNGLGTDDAERAFNENLGKLTAVASENVLKSLWDTPEEDEAWRHLQRETS